MVKPMVYVLSGRCRNWEGDSIGSVVRFDELELLVSQQRNSRNPES